MTTAARRMLVVCRTNEHAGSVWRYERPDDELSATSTPPFEWAWKDGRVTRFVGLDALDRQRGTRWDDIQFRCSPTQEQRDWAEANIKALPGTIH